VKKIARFWDFTNGAVCCYLCPHRCVIKPEKRGMCGVRENRDGVLYSLIYASCSSVAPDPIEKKPLYHFHPGSRTLSLGTVGCNLTCLHCQNHKISQARPEDTDFVNLSPMKAVTTAHQHECQGIAYTYNEPSIWWEYTFDGTKEAKKHGLYTVYVTNGFTSEGPIREIAPYLDAANVDIKSMNDDFYRRNCGGRLQAVLDTCTLYHELDIHLELTFLVIPNHNDNEDNLKRFACWVRDELDPNVPVHFSAFYPHYKMTDVPCTPASTLQAAYEIAKQEGLTYAYLGNLPPNIYENTYCPECEELLIERHGYTSQIKGLEGTACSNCGQKIPVVVK
jgi:pyruvate formate lyase activating enzyme